MTGPERLTQDNVQYRYVYHVDQLRVVWEPCRLRLLLNLSHVGHGK